MWAHLYKIGAGSFAGMIVLGVLAAVGTILQLKWWPFHEGSRLTAALFSISDGRL
jgi:hypothetical protein